MTPLLQIIIAHQQQIKMRLIRSIFFYMPGGPKLGRILYEIQIFRRFQPIYREISDQLKSVITRSRDT